MRSPDKGTKNNHGGIGIASPLGRCPVHNQYLEHEDNFHAGDLHAAPMLGIYLYLLVPTGRYVVPTGRVVATDSVIVATSGYVVLAAYDIRPGRVK
ncbi:hypothetical protein Tco_1085525 [Tanacetum coccineum]